MQCRDRLPLSASRKPDRFVLSFVAHFLLIGNTLDTDTLGHVQVYLYPQRKPTSPGRNLSGRRTPSTPHEFAKDLKTGMSVSSPSYRRL
jgi:hypothetical protein